MGSTADHQHDYEERRVPPAQWEQQPDIAHPSHYTYAPIECIDAMQKLYGVEKTIAYCELAAFKYRWRAGYKDDIGKDISKALWYERKARELKETLGRMEHGVIG